MRTIIAGSRSASRHDTLAAIAECPWRHEITVVISGGAAGADTHGESWARSANLLVERYPAAWALLGRRAGAARNIQMGGIADALIAVWDGTSRGTAHMIQVATSRALRCFVYKIPQPDPTRVLWVDEPAVPAVPATRTFVDLKVEESFDVAGGELHDDLAGLVCVITAAAIEHTPSGHTRVTDKRTKDVITFKSSEPIDMYKRNRRECVP